MRTLLILTIMVLAFGLKAQNFKNEVQINQSTVYHFDGNPFIIIEQISFLNGTGFTYKRRLKNNFKIYGSFNHFSLGYDAIDENGNYPQFWTHEKKQILIGRGHQNYSLGSSKKLTIWKILKLEPYTGLILRIGYQQHFDGFLEGQTGHPAGFASADSLNALGFSVGNQFKVKFFKRLNIGVQFTYSRFLNEYVKNQLISSAFIGFEFER